MADNEPATLTVAQLAKYLALDERRIQQLEKMGIVVKKGRGKYLPFPSIPNYVAFLRNGGNLEGAKNDPQQTISRDTIGAKDILFEEYLLTKAKREQQEMKVAEAKQDLHRTEVVRKWVMGMILSAKKRLRAMPAKLAVSLAATSDADLVAEMLLNEIDDSLREVAANAGDT